MTAKDDAFGKTEFFISQFNPLPPSEKGTLSSNLDSAPIIALDTVSKFLFIDDEGNEYHSYRLPSNPDINNVAGYVDKVLKYTNPDLLEYLSNCPLPLKRSYFTEAPFNILSTRSPLLDFEVLQLIKLILLERPPGSSVSLLDVGCTVSEHWTFLDLLLKKEIGKSALDILYYTGVDKSALLLSVAMLLNPIPISTGRMSLVHSEGTAFQYTESPHDVALSIGVVNHVYDPISTLTNLLLATREGVILALWITLLDRGFWSTTHSGLSCYFFSVRELLELESLRNGFQFFVTDYIPEEQNTQEGSYIGLGSEQMRSLGCIHLTFTHYHPQAYKPLASYSFYGGRNSFED